MTEVTLVRDGSPYTGYWYTVEATGHATGSVELCAAVSTLVQTLDAWLTLRGSAVSERRIEPGDCRLRFSGHCCGVVWELMCVGFRGLEATDPETVHVTIRKK